MNSLGADMVKDIQRTGSISQDAIRLGFQTTCNAGIERLLKINDITKESCVSFEERHREMVQESFENLCEKLISEHESNFRRRMSEEFNPKNPKSLISSIGCLVKTLLFGHILKKQAIQKIEIYDISIKETRLNLNVGRWETSIEYKEKKFSWCGYYNGVWKEFKEEVKVCSEQITTSGQKCNVQYIPYDNYHDNYIPDDAAQAAFEAISIGMTKLLVAKPISKTVKDPIIVGHVDNQMFIIAWFGYDKNNHMACNV